MGNYVKRRGEKRTVGLWTYRVVWKKSWPFC